MRNGEAGAGEGSEEAETERQEWREMYLMIESREVRSLYTTTNILKNTRGTSFSTSRNTYSWLLSSVPLPRRDSLCFSISTFNLSLSVQITPPTYTYTHTLRQEDESSIKSIDQNNHRATERTRQKKRERRSCCLLPNPPKLSESFTNNLLKVLIKVDLSMNLKQAHHIIM